MPFDVTYVEDAGYVSGVLSGDMSGDQLEVARQAMNEQLIAHDCRRLFVDATKIDRMQSVFADFDFTTEHRNKLPLGTRHAVVIRAERKPHMQFIEDVAQNRAINLRIFLDRDEAVNWLLGS